MGNRPPLKYLLSPQWPQDVLEFKSQNPSSIRERVDYGWFEPIHLEETNLGKPKKFLAHLQFSQDINEHSKLMDS